MALSVCTQSVLANDSLTGCSEALNNTKMTHFGPAAAHINRLLRQGGLRQTAVKISREFGRKLKLTYLMPQVVLNIGQ